ncbi:hypothetical protein [Chitinimonas lacunae]|uniref:HEAT repeat domain-containing protein n=1 Tax=Chitinimonas lacunae TaxID=1963018 RepID=A0ABV8MP88_9NEIS
MSNIMKFKQFDNCLRDADIVSMDEANDGPYEAAENWLGQFSYADWIELELQWSKRPANWRICLASLLRPQQGPAAERLLLDMVRDPNETVAFRALLQVTFYCGVISAERGTLINSAIRVPRFLSLVRREPFLGRHIERISAFSAEPFRLQFRRLLDTLHKPA